MFLSIVLCLIYKVKQKPNLRRSTMAANKLINFRCPDDLLAAIEAYGREHYPTTPNNRGSVDYDQSKAIRDILISGIETLTNGEVKIERKAEKPKSSYAELLDMLDKNRCNIAELSCYVADLLDRVTKIEAQQTPAINLDIEARLSAMESALSGKYSKIQSLIPDLMGIVDEFNADS